MLSSFKIYHNRDVEGHSNFLYTNYSKINGAKEANNDLKVFTLFLLYDLLIFMRLAFLALARNLRHPQNNTKTLY